MIIRGLAVYAFSFGREIGVDLEAVRAVPDGDDIVARFFSRRENETYLALDVRDRPLGFFNCWTCKEAFIKALGDGLYYRFDCFDVSLTPGEPAKIHRVESAPGDDCGWCLDSFSPAPGFVVAVVIESGRPNAFATAPSRSTWATISRSSACSLRVWMAIPSRSRVEELAAYFAAQIRAFRPGGPYIIAGFVSGM